MTIRSKSNIIGQTKMSNCGQLMTLIKYDDSMNIDVQFEDGTVVRNKTYKNFRTGSIRNPNCHIGEVKKNNRGQIMTVVQQHKNGKVSVKFEDGTLVENKSYANFKDGHIKNPNEHVGEKFKLKDGRIATIIEYNYKGVKVELNTGEKVSNIGYRTLVRGSLGRNPKYE